MHFLLASDIPCLALLMGQAMMVSEKPIVAAFDFDGTVTQKDTFIDFARFSLSSWRFWFGIFLFSPLLALVVLHAISGGWVKEKLFSFWFSGWTYEAYQEKAIAYCNQRFDQLIRPKALASIQEHLKKGHELFFVSACTEEVLKPFAKRLGIPLGNVLGTKTSVLNEKLTGHFEGANCKGAEKVKRLLSAKPNRSEYYLVAYGDSSGDKELLRFADKSFYREFQ